MIPSQIKKGNVSDQSKEGLSKSETWKHEMSGKDTSSHSSLYDSGRTDSGFLSGGNILTEQLSEGDISPPGKPSSPEVEPEQKSFMRLDSGVDVGLSEQLSELCIEENLNNLDSDTKTQFSTPSVISSVGPNITSPPSPQNTSSLEGSKAVQGLPWQLYFEQDEEGDTQLHIAIIQGFIEVVYSLVQMVPSPHYLDIYNDIRQTGMHLAVLTSQPRIVRRLVCAGARTDIVDRHGNTPLHLATEAGDLACVQALTTPITVAETAAAGLKYASNQRPPHPPELDMCNYEGLSCVHLAVMGGHIDILRHLHWLGADINAREWKSGRTGLHMAVESGNKILCRMLLETMGAEPGTRTYAGHTAYRYARANPMVQGIFKYQDDSDYSSSEDEDDDTELQMLESTFRDLRSNGIVAL